MNKYWIYLVAPLLGALVLMASPQQADAAIRLGVDLKWVPVSSETASIDGVKGEGDIKRDISSMGFGARGLMGPDLFAAGLKINLIQNKFKNDDDSDDGNFNQLDINAIARIGLPFFDLAFFAEAGPSVSLDYGGFGYNVVLGAEYDVLPLPLFSLNIGIAGQYTSVPTSVSADINVDIESTRLWVYLGFDFSI